MLFTRSSWDRFKGQTKWIIGTRGSIEHTQCGTEIIQVTQRRTILEDSTGLCAADGQENVSILYCPKCDPEPIPVSDGSPILKSELLEINL